MALDVTLLRAHVEPFQGMDPDLRLTGSVSDRATAADCM
jgi:hypothetical protein